MTHFWNRNREVTHKSAQVDYLVAWCGREVMRNTATATLASVECKQCREAFAKVLRELPDAFPVAESN